MNDNHAARQVQALSEIGESGLHEPVNILVVDDLPEKLLVYRSILEELGQNLMTASSGEEALKYVLKHEFAVILMDVNMPGMDGFETASLIRQRRKSSHTPIIFLTAFTDELHMAQSYASGAVDYLTTPVVPKILKAKVKVFIELFQMRRQAALQAEERAKRTAAEESARRSSFMVKVSEVLAQSKNRAEILGALTHAAVPYLADMSLLYLSDEEHQQKYIEWVWMDGDEKLHAENLTSLPAEPWLEKALEQTLQTGRVQVLPKLSGETDSLQPIRAAQAALVLPITIHEETLGALVLMKRQAGGPWQADDISLASDMVNRGGHVLEKAMLIERIQEADRRKDEFLGMLAHELRNPLGPIRNAVQLLHMTSPKSARLAQAKDIVDRQVAHMARLIDDLLDATRLARGKVLLRSERCDLTQLVRQTAEDYRSIFHASGLKLKTHIPETSLWIQGDPTRLVQAIGNLLHNAHKFTDPGGTITVKLTHQEKNGQAMISIQDTGIGIEPKMLPCIFDVFRQADQGLARSRGGLGLGLALVKGLVELHHGKVKVSSKGPGKGSEFSISLPVEVASYKVEESQAPMPEISKYRILVIEDNRDAAESAQLLLTLEGHRVRVAHNGPEGLEIAKIFLPQVILCDIGLPGMDGYEVARQLRQEPELTGVYIVALTGYGRDEDQRNAQEAGFDLHLTKPIDYSMLRRALAYLPARV